MPKPEIGEAVPASRPRPPLHDHVIVTQYLLDPRRAISETGVVCLVCGRSFRHLTNTHLRGHGLTSGEYKERFGYNLRRALMIPPVRRAHADNARRAGLAERIRRRPRLDLELRRMGGRHPHALEELLTRRERRPLGSGAMSLRDTRGRFAREPAAPSGPRPDG